MQDKPMEMEALKTMDNPVHHQQHEQVERDYNNWAAVQPF